MPKGNTLATYVYGDYVDDVLNMQRDLNADGIAENYYYLSDGQYNVTGVFDSKGNVLERYVYGTFGEPYFFDGSGTVGPVHQPVGIGQPLPVQRAAIRRRHGFCISTAPAISIQSWAALYPETELVCGAMP